MSNTYFLYADDDDDDVALLKEMLLEKGATTSLASVSDGYELLHFLQEVAVNKAYPALIILDLSMPKLNGIETLQLLKTDDMYRLIPVLVLSARISEQQRIVCKANGAEIVMKPSSYEEWGSVLRKLHTYVDEDDNSI